MKAKFRSDEEVKKIKKADNETIQALILGVTAEEVEARFGDSLKHKSPPNQSKTVKMRSRKVQNPREKAREALRRQIDKGGGKEDVTSARKKIPVPLRGEDYMRSDPPGHNCEMKWFETPCYRMNNNIKCEKQILRTCEMRRNVPFDGCCCSGEATEYKQCDLNLPACKR